MTTLNDLTSGDNTTGHVVSAVAIGGALSAISVWVLQLFHLIPPAAVDQGITDLCVLAASLLMQRVSKP